ncbi:MAG: NADH-quinone oxidoreductase subunit C, partial [Anaerolineae bacterium]|nr:NADH-quinone oxidoreductase subunit C [Anaerolineae bacterium]
MSRLETLVKHLGAALGEKIASTKVALGEVTIVVPAAEHLEVARPLRDDERLRFEQLIDLACVDYRDYGHGAWSGSRFAVVMHLLSVTHNWRLRVRTFCPDDDLPVVASVTSVWASAGWFEREAF